ncbi:type IA DNA topoisomerase [Ornithinibacillus bavariensis]|uniref:DNA topoisomerase n=1 Tax=Ornithinibacillus bavariensis TaxID=545502 RepID=A0A919X855_9BACI|nr:type IA DNA topoisomerase [Ornithinibacillus bavariensis]GIO25955.1 DNA topoisomerase [Ornithinibacillus bavariensis]
MKLILAEKPSVAKNIADALGIRTKKDGYFEGNGYLISWAFGHLLQLYDAKDYDSKMASWKMDNFPFIPEKFEYKVKSSPRNKQWADQGAKKQLQIIHSLMKRVDVESIISACDYDREGQLIGDSIIYRAKPNKPIYRLLLNEWTKDEVLRGLAMLRPNEELRPLQDAGVSRQWADWVIGINLTSVATLKYQKGKGKALNIGRVLLPTLKIIYDRDKEIEDFVPEDYFKLTAIFQAKNGKYEGTYVVNKEEKFKQKEVLEKVLESIQEKQGEIIEKKIETKKEFPPFLFNLSNLQGHITSKYKGWTSDKVLKVAQSLYEKKYITYPRTSSTALEESLVGKTAKVLSTLKEDLPYQDEVKFMKTKRVFNNAKVESHSAIIPTYVKPKRLTADEQIVYNAIKNRFVMQFMPIAEYEETRLTTKILDVDLLGVFESKGRVQLVEGWKKVESVASKDKLLPRIEENEIVQLVDSEVTKHITKPPKAHTEKTLLRVMETCGKSFKEEDNEEMVGSILTGFSIGTPATRAETIKKLKDVGYIAAQGKNLTCTDLGKKLVETFPVKSLFDLEFTGRLEKTLSDIQKGTVNKQRFLNIIFDFTKESVATIKKDQEITIHEVTGTHAKARYEVLGTCPNCGGNIVEGPKGFGCSNWKKGCKFAIWKNDKYLGALKKKPTKTMVKSLLQNKKALVKGLTSKQGKKFNAYLSYEKNVNNDYYSWKMEFEK